MKNLILLVLFMVVVSTSFAGKKSKPVMKIGDQSFSLDEFEFVYNKNNQLSQTPISPTEYLDLFVNYKLKVKEAEAQGLDTTASFIKEFNYYRDELAKPYLTDKKAEEDIMKEAYDRLKYEVDASHILIRLPSIPTPEDTLKAYNQAKEILDKLHNGADFGDMAVKYSEDPSAKTNRGHLGYFTGFNMVYPFESAVYNTPVDSISGIVRTNFGYHIIKVLDKRPASGQMNAAHIMKAFPKNSPEEVQNKAKNSIDSIYQLLLDGQPFEELAKKYSDDRNSAVNGGEIGWFGYGRMIPEFADPAFKLKNNGDISEPIKTPFGWHIIKRIDHKGLESFDEMKDNIQKRISSDQRAYAGQNAIVDKLKKDYKYNQFNSNLDTLKSILSIKGINDSTFFAKSRLLVHPLVQFAGKTYTQGDFSTYLEENKKFSTKKGILELDNQLTDYGKQKLLDYEKNKLESKYPEFKYLVSEYHDGLLIFDISQKEIWNKASEDTTGLENFFNKHKDNYPKPENWSGTLYYCKDKDVEAKIDSIISEGIVINDSILSGLGIKKSWIKKEKGEFKKGDNPYVDLTFFNDTTISDAIPENYTTVLAYGEMNPEGLYELSEIRGQVLSDYQTEIEKNWIAKLREKYKPKIYYKAVSKIKPVNK